MHVELAENQKIKVTGTVSVFKVMRQILLRENEIERAQEHVWIIGLAPNSTIVHIELVSLGDMTQALIKPMQVFRVALIKGAVAVIMVHNHPSGILKPSDGDLDNTDRMIQVGKIIDVKVIDHLIISEEKFFSFKKAGLMEKLEQSKKWVPEFVEEERLRKEKEKIRKEAMKIGEIKGLKEGKKIGKQIGLEKVAKKSLKEGLSIELISKLTGLTKEEIEKL